MNMNRVMWTAASVRMARAIEQGRRRHTENDCDETCHSCAQCYVQHRGREVCSKTCEHAEPTDD